jgi:branched-chain amino acid transport system permease protein
VRTPAFLLIWLVVCAAVFAASVWLGNDYIFFAGYVVLQYVVLGTAGTFSAVIAVM